MIVVTDTSVILNLCLIGKEKVLPLLFGKVLCPTSVRAEFVSLSERDPRFVGLVFPEFINVTPVEKISPELIGNHKIHQGEIEANQMRKHFSLTNVRVATRLPRRISDALAFSESFFKQKPKVWLNPSRPFLTFSNHRQDFGWIHCW